jgi:putative copper export protein
MENNILIFIHLLAAAIGLGSTAYCVLLLLPALEKQSSGKAPDETSARYKALDILSPTVFTAVLTLIGTGIIYLMENYTSQVNLKPGYYNLFGLKMASVAAVFFLSAYQTFGLRSRIAHLDLRPENRKLTPRTLQQMTSFGKLILGFFALAVFLGVCLARL